MGRIIGIAFVVLFAVVLLLPTGVMVLGSFQAGGIGTMRIPPSIAPGSLTFDNYRIIWTEGMLIPGWAAMTLLVTVLSVSSATVTAVAAGYALAHKFLGHRVVVGMTMFGAIVPMMIFVIPRFLTLRLIGLGTGVVAAVLPLAVSPLGILYSRAHLLRIGGDYFDDARIAGAGEWRILWSIVLPMSGSVIALVLTFTGLGALQDYLWQSLVMPDERKQTLIVGLMSTIMSPAMWKPHGYGLKMAIATAMLLPMLGVFAVGYRWFTGGEGVKL